MKIIFDIGVHKQDIISPNWIIDLSQPFPASIGDRDGNLYIMNIRIEDKEEDNGHNNTS